MENDTRVFSEKERMLLVLNNYTFYKYRITQVGITWRFTLKSCISKFIINLNEQVFL